MDKKYEFDGVITKVEGGGAYVSVPYDIRKEFGKGRLMVSATFDGVAYDGSIVNMGVKNPDGTICYIIGIRRDIQQKIGKGVGDSVHVTFVEREKEPLPYSTIDEYIATFPKEIGERMQTIREIIMASHPDIGEKISWGMATFTLNGNLAHFSGEKNHIGFHPAPETIAAFKPRFDEMGLKSSKGTVQLPHNKPLPIDLLKDMMEFRVKII